MPYQYTMKDIKRKRDPFFPAILKGKALLIPGGWVAEIPKVEVEQAILNRYQEGFQKLGMNEQQAKESAWLGAQKVFRAGFIKAVRECVLRRGCDYAKIYPDLVEHHRHHRTLRGFMPERVQHIYLPHNNQPTVVGLGLLAEMAAEARAEMMMEAGLSPE